MNHLGLVECIDPMMPQDFNQRTVSIGLAECRLTAPPRQASPATPPLEGCPKGGVVVGGSIAVIFIMPIPGEGSGMAEPEFTLIIRVCTGRLYTSSHRD